MTNIITYCLKCCYQHYLFLDIDSAVILTQKFPIGNFCVNNTAYFSNGNKKM